MELSTSSDSLPGLKHQIDSLVLWSLSALFEFLGLTSSYLHFGVHPFRWPQGAVPLFCLIRPLGVLLSAQLLCFWMSQQYLNPCAL